MLCIWHPPTGCSLTIIHDFFSFYFYFKKMCYYVRNMFIRTCSKILGILYDLSDFQQQFIFSLDMFVRLV